MILCSSNLLVSDSSYWTGPLTISTLIQGPIGVNCISGGNAGVVFTDDLESSMVGQVHLEQVVLWRLECKNWTYRINRNWTIWSS